MLRILAGVLVGLMVLVGTASAGIPDPDLSFVTLGPDLGMTSCPAGDGPAYEYITVTARHTRMYSATTRLAKKKLHALRPPNSTTVYA